MRRLLAFSLLTVALASCSALEGTIPNPSQTPRYALTVNLHVGDTPRALEARYGGRVEVWRAEDGFAILGVNQVPSNDPAVRGADENVQSVSLPEPSAANLRSETVQTGGWTAWSGGWTAWSGGWTAWSGGTGSSLSPTENKSTWAKIGLSAAQARAKNLGGGVRIAVIDTGIDLAHPAFTNRLVSSADMYDFVNNDAIPQEVEGSGNYIAYGHGTGVAGVIAQIAPNAKIMPLRALSRDGSGSETAVANAINWAINHNAQIIQLSLGSPTDSAALGSMVGAAVRKGIYVVASAGNANSASATFPAYYASGLFNLVYNCLCNQFVVSVASVTSGDKKSPFSNYGSGVSVSAPGEYVYSPYPSDRVGYWSGTSFAAPMASGAIALAMGQQATSLWSQGQMAANVTNSGDVISLVDPLYGIYLGAGRLNINKFLQRMGL